MRNSQNALPTEEPLREQPVLTRILGLVPRECAARYCQCEVSFDTYACHLWPAGLCGEVHIANLLFGNGSPHLWTVGSRWPNLIIHGSSQFCGGRCSYILLLRYFISVAVVARVLIHWNQYHFPGSLHVITISVLILFTNCAATYLHEAEHWALANCSGILYSPLLDVAFISDALTISQVFYRVRPSCSTTSQSSLQLNT